MFNASIQNVYGETLGLTHNPAYTIKSITGLSPVKAAINTSVMATSDGALFNSSRKGERNIVITITINGDVETNRLKLYQYAPTKYPVRFFYKNALRDVFIDGYVESNEVNLFENGQSAQISIICPQPFFKSVKEVATEFSSIEPLFEFSFFTNYEEPIEMSSLVLNNQESVYNEGEVETGVIIEILATSDVVNPVIYNRGTSEKFQINFEMKESDIIRINTNTGEKAVTLIRDGKETNIINAISIDNDWFVLRSGENIFTYAAKSGFDGMRLKITVSNKFEGV